MSTHCCLMSGTVWIDEGLLKSMILHACLSTIWLFSFGKEKSNQRKFKSTVTFIKTNRPTSSSSTFCIKLGFVNLAIILVSFRFGQRMLLNDKSDTSMHLRMCGLCNALVLQILTFATFGVLLSQKHPTSKLKTPYYLTMSAPNVQYSVKNTLSTLSIVHTRFSGINFSINTLQNLCFSISKWNNNLQVVLKFRVANNLYCQQFNLQLN